MVQYEVQQSNHHHHTFYTGQFTNFADLIKKGFTSPEVYIYRAFHKLPQIYTTNHATFLIQMYAITV